MNHFQAAHDALNEAIERLPKAMQRKIEATLKILEDAAARERAKPSEADEFADRIVALEAGLREIERVADARTIPDRNGKLIESCNETCLHECVAISRKTIRGDPLPHRGKP